MAFFSVIILSRETNAETSRREGVLKSLQEIGIQTGTMHKILM